MVATVNSDRIFVEGEKPTRSSNGHLFWLYGEDTV